MKSIDQKKPGHEGSVIVFCAIFVFIASIIGIAAMDMSLVQAKMSRNQLYTLQAFQTARSEQQQQYESVTADIDTLYTAMTESQSLSPILSSDHSTQETSIRYLGETNALSGYSIGKFRAQQYEINTTSKYKNIEAVSDQVLSFKYTTPATE